MRGTDTRLVGSDPLVKFRWGSWLGAAVILFLIYGGLNFLLAIVVPLSMITGGSAALFGGPVFSMDGDTYLFGRTFDRLRATDPKLDTLFVSSMVSMCSQMMQYAILDVGLAWFVLRRAHRWGFWVLAVGAVVSIPYYLTIASMYAAQGAPWASGLIGLVPFYLIPIVGLMVGVIGVERTRDGLAV